MRVPLYVAGPGLPAGGRIDHARLVDVMPTVLDLLGESGRLNEIDPIDGVSVAAELKAAPPRPTPADAKAVQTPDKN
jgi:arylsulfatase A-like enzyme